MFKKRFLVLTLSILMAIGGIVDWALVLEVRADGIENVGQSDDTTDENDKEEEETLLSGFDVLNTTNSTTSEDHMTAGGISVSDFTVSNKTPHIHDKVTFSFKVVVSDDKTIGTISYSIHQGNRGSAQRGISLSEDDHSSQYVASETWDMNYYGDWYIDHVIVTCQTNEKAVFVDNRGDKDLTGSIVVDLSSDATATITAPNDDTPPVVDFSTLSATKSEAVLGEWVYIRIKVTDDTEVKDVLYDIKRGEGTQPVSNGSMSYNSDMGLYEARIETDVNGTYEIRSLRVIDTVGNKKEYYNSKYSAYDTDEASQFDEQVDLSAANFVVTSDDINDEEGPVIDIETLEVAEKNVGITKTNEIRVKVSDQSQIKGVYFTIRQPDGSIMNMGNAPKDSSGDYYVKSIPCEYFGTVQVARIEAIDVNGNDTWLFNNACDEGKDLTAYATGEKEDLSFANFDVGLFDGKSGVFATSEDMDKETTLIVEELPDTDERFGEMFEPGYYWKWFFDIHLGGPWQPTGSQHVRIKFPIRHWHEGDMYRIRHWLGNGNIQTEHCKVHDGYIWIDVRSFSPFLIESETENDASLEISSVEVLLPKTGANGDVSTLEMGVNQTEKYYPSINVNFESMYLDEAEDALAEKDFLSIPSKYFSVEPDGTNVTEAKIVSVRRVDSVQNADLYTQIASASYELEVAITTGKLAGDGSVKIIANVDGKSDEATIPVRVRAISGDSENPKDVQEDDVTVKLVDEVEVTWSNKIDEENDTEQGEALNGTVHFDPDSLESVAENLEDSSLTKEQLDALGDVITIEPAVEVVALDELDNAASIEDAAKEVLAEAVSKGSFRLLALDIKLYASGNGSKFVIAQPGIPVGIKLPYDVKGKHNFGIWRYHDSLRWFDRRNNASEYHGRDAEFYVENDGFQMSTAYFSDYAVTYSEGVEVTEKSMTNGGTAASGTNTSTSASSLSGSRSTSSRSGGNYSNRSSSSSSSGNSKSESIGSLHGKGASKAYYKKIGKNTMRYVMPALGSKARTAKVPATITIKNKTYKVTAIASDAFAGYNNLTSVIIGKNIKKIGRRAFDGSSNLKTVTVKTKKLKKSSVKDSLKGSNVTTLTVPASKVDVYGKLFTQANSGSKRRISVKAKKTK